MPRLERKIMDGWEFSLNSCEEGDFRPVKLPHDWAITAPFDKNMEQGEAQGFRHRWGIGWYRRTYHVKEKRPGHRYCLDFGGIYENSTVWVNGKNAGGRKYGYSSFRLDITELVQQGENQILINVDNTCKPADRWYSGAGIYRTVKWIEVEDNHFEEENIIVRSSIDGTAADILVTPGIKGNIRAVLSLGKFSLEAVEDEDGLLFRLEDARLWSAESPNLYTLSLFLMDGQRIADYVTMKIGIRVIKMVQGKGMFVNGERVTLKGVCIHQDVGCRGIAARPELWRSRLENLKEMGCNTIRTAHHTFAPEFLDLCDEMGFYVYEECFDKWTGGLYGRYFKTEWKRDVEAMVKRDRNRACIFIWGVGNEVEHQAQDSMIKILEMLRNFVQSMDGTRPITYAMNPHFKRESKVDISKVKDIQQFVDEVDDTEIYGMEERLERIRRIASLVDVISCNYQEQWYEEIHKMIPEKLILGTETYEFFKGHREQMQNFTCENPQLVPVEKKYVIGSMIWTGIDYLGESMGYPAKGWSGAPIRTNGERRPAYYILQSYWSKKPMVHFSVLDYSLEDEGVKEHWDIPIYADHWHFPQFHKTVIPYMICSNCDEVKLLLNGKRLYLPRLEECPNRLITGFLPCIPGRVEAIGCIGGKEACRHVLLTPGPAVKMGFDQEAVTFRAEKGYEFLLTAGAQDEQGNPYFREGAKVRFRIEGPAEIAAVDNGSLMGNEPYEESFIHMYHGRASVLIRMTGEKGRISVYADVEGMKSGTAVICAE